jgi:pimeloyl-ACP methyl ester carboxylesterase
MADANGRPLHARATSGPGAMFGGRMPGRDPHKRNGRSRGGRRQAGAVLALVVLFLTVGAAGLVLSRTWNGQQLMALIEAGGLVNVRVAAGTEGEPVVLASRGVVMRGSLHRPKAKALLPGIILVHGQTPEGRRLPLYVLLARELAARCYAVLALDLPGFGDSDMPLHPDEPASWDARIDIIGAMQYLRGLPFIDPEHIGVLGHSMGANLAVGSGALDRRIHSVVAIGPPHPAAEAWIADGLPNHAHFHEAFSRTRGLKQPLPLKTYLTWVSLLDMETYLDHYSGPSHQPLLLIDASQDPPVRQDSNARLSQLISEAKKYITIPNANHYNNTAGIGRFIFYDRVALHILVDEIDLWLRKAQEHSCEDKQ